MILDMIQYAIKDSDRYIMLIEQHLFIDVVVLLICIIVGVPIGYLCAKKAKISVPIIAIATLFMMIPSLALFALLQPIFGMGSTPAMIALILGGLPLIIINTKSGYMNVDKIICENACALGMEKWRVCLAVETPLALPAILNGLRISAVSIIAGTAIATYIGAGGLGFYINMGIGTRNFAVSYLGAFTVAVIAVIVDMLLTILQKKQLKKVTY